MSKKDSLKIIPFSFTANALSEIKKILQEKNIPAEYGVRVGIKGGGGCGGVSFLLGFDTFKEGDDNFEIEEVKVFMEKRQAMFLAGKIIDFEDGAVARGFVFNDPQT